MTELVISQQGVLRDVEFIQSPNFDARPTGVDIDTIVIHGISLPEGKFGGSNIQRLFTNTLDATDHPSFIEVAQLKVSAHVLIRRDGGLIQFVAFSERAWHAGQSQLNQRQCCNDFSIGIELEGCDYIPYMDAQYESLNRLITALMLHYPAILAQNIVGHADIAPGRKTDPGLAFDWNRIEAKKPERFTTE